MLINKSILRHILHIFCFLTFLTISQIIGGGIRFNETSLERDSVDPIEQYGLVWTIFLYSFRFLIFLPLPLCICHVCVHHY